jgi:hypothetical protein
MGAFMLIPQTHTSSPLFVMHRAQLQKNSWQRVCGTMQESGILLHGGTVEINASQSYPKGTWVVAYGVWNGMILEAIFVAKLSDAKDTSIGYQKTHYCAGSIAIQIGSKNPGLECLLAVESVQTWMFVTAWNPYSRETPNENQRRNKKLEATLRRKRKRFVVGWGIPHCRQWEPEASFLVLGVSKKEAEQWMLSFMQNAVVFGSGEDAMLLFQ